MKRYTLILILSIFFLNSFSQSNLTENIRVENVYNSTNDIPTTRNFTKVNCSIISPFEFDKKFNAKVENSVNEYFCAYFEGEVISSEIGFYKSPKELINTHKIETEPQIKYSRNGNFIIVVGMYNDRIFLFEKNGKFLFETKSDTLLNSNCNLYNAFVDNSCEWLLINNSYHLHLYSIKEKKLIWSNKYEFRRIQDCIYFRNKEIIAIKSLTPIKKRKTKSDTYTLQIISTKTGKVLSELFRVANIDKIESNLLVELDNKYIEYSINNNSNYP